MLQLLTEFDPPAREIDVGDSELFQVHENVDGSCLFCLIGTESASATIINGQASSSVYTLSGSLRPMRKKPASITLRAFDFTRYRGTVIRRARMLFPSAAHAVSIDLESSRFQDESCTDQSIDTRCCVSHIPRQINTHNNVP